MFSKEIIHSQPDNIFGESMHAKRINSLSLAEKA